MIRGCLLRSACSLPNGKLLFSLVFLEGSESNRLEAAPSFFDGIFTNGRKRDKLISVRGAGGSVCWFKRAFPLKTQAGD